MYDDDSFISPVEDDDLAQAQGRIRQALTWLNYYIDHATGPIGYDIQPEDLCRIAAVLAGQTFKEHNEEEK